MCTKQFWLIKTWSEGSVTVFFLLFKGKSTQIGFTMYDKSYLSKFSYHRKQRSNLSRKLLQTKIDEVQAAVVTVLWGGVSSKRSSEWAVPNLTGGDSTSFINTTVLLSPTPSAWLGAAFSVDCGRLLHYYLDEKPLTACSFSSLYFSDIPIPAQVLP